MANHSFNITLAEKYGVEQAILIEHIYWWVHKNECDGIEDMVKDGKVWCRSTAKGFAKYIPYLKPDKIWRILRKMEGHILLVGNFNKQVLNQTLWYTFTDEFKKELEDLNYDFENFKNANLKNEKSYNSIINNPINKEDKIKEDEKVLSDDNTKKDESGIDIIKDSFPDFADFWKKYHQGSKQVALKRWNNMSPKDQKLAIDMIDDYLVYCKRCKRPKKDVATFLYNKCYLDDYKNIIPDYYQVQPTDNGRMVKFKQYMVDRFRDLIYHRNPLTFEQASELLEQYDIEQFEDAMDKLAKVDIHQYFSIMKGVETILNEGQ